MPKKPTKSNTRALIEKESHTKIARDRLAKQDENKSSNSYSASSDTPRAVDPSDMDSSDSTIPSEAGMATSSKYRKRAINDNWAKYEISPVDDELNENQLNSDFEFLMKNSTSCSNYFKLSSEKQWEKEMVNSNTNIFQLDVNLLSDSLACIPFYDRIGLDKNLLNNSETKRCDLDAEQHSKKYEPVYEKLRTERKYCNSEISPVDRLAENISELNVDTTEMNRIPCNSSPSESKITFDVQKDVVEDRRKLHALKTPSHSVEEDLEEWLDTVLDD